MRVRDSVLEVVNHFNGFVEVDLNMNLQVGLEIMRLLWQIISCEKLIGF